MRKIIVLWFRSPDGKMGFTEADSVKEAVETAKVYKSHGYHLVEHGICNV